MGGGLISALVGPELVRQFADAMPVQYAGAYAAVAVVNLIGALVLAFLAIPRAVVDRTRGHTGRPLLQILRDRNVVGAMLCAMISYAVMILVMTATPLAMVGSGFHADHAADVVRWHVLAMFAPSFVTGSLIERFGHRAVIGTGLVLLASCAAVALSGVDLHQFYVALIALGLGWNFGFVGATSLLASAHSREEQAKVQGLNDFLVFGLVAVASFGSGALLSELGWSAVALAVIPAVALAAVVLAWLGVNRPRTHPPG
jgi:predicted MFS family arabinose efflux permease